MRRIILPLSAVAGFAALTPATASPLLTAYAFSAAGQSSCATFGPTAPVRSALLASGGVAAVSTPGPGCNVVEDLHNNVAAAGSITASSSAAAGPFNTSFGAGSTSVSSASRAAPGQLGAKADATFSGATDAFTVTGSEAFGQFRDDLTVTGGGGDGIFRPTFTVDGSLAVVGRGQGELLLTYQKDSGSQFGAYSINVTGSADTPFVSSFNGYTSTSSPPAGLSVLPGQVSGTADVTFDVPIVFGQSFDLTMTLFASALPRASTGQAFPSAVSTDFLTSATLTHIDILDGSGRPLGSFGITTGSGAIFGPNGVQPGAATVDVPEPASLALLVLGLAGLGAMRRSGSLPANFD